MARVIREDGFRLRLADSTKSGQSGWAIQFSPTHDNRIRRIAWIDLRRLWQRDVVFRQSGRTGPAIYNVRKSFTARTRRGKASARGYPALYGIWLGLCARTLAGVAATHLYRFCRSIDT